MVYGPRQTPRVQRQRSLSLLASYFADKFGADWRDTAVMGIPCLGCKQLLTLVYPKLMNAGKYTGLLLRYFYSKFSICDDCPDGTTLYCLNKKHARNCTHRTDMEIEFDYGDFMAALILLTKWGRSELEKEIIEFRRSQYHDTPGAKRGRRPLTISRSERV